MILRLNSFARLLVLTSVLLSPAFATAQTFPTHSLTFVIPFLPNPGADPFLRAVSQAASKSLGQQVVLDYKAGAGGRIGLQTVMSARPDGYTIGYGHTGNVILQPLITPSLMVEPGKDYATVGSLYDSPQGLFVNPNAPFKDVRGLIEYARQNPHKLNGGSNGIGGPSHLALEMFKTLANVDIVHVPFKGEAESFPALIADQIQMIITTGSKGFVDAGRLKILATTGKARWDIYPDTPTAIESGLQNFYFTVWNGVVAPAATPGDVIAQINAAFNAGLKTPEVLRLLQPTGGVPIIESPAQVLARLRDDFERLGPIVKKAGIKMEQ